MTLIKIIIEALLILVSSLLIIKTLDKHDTSVDLKITKVDMIMTCIMSTLFSIIINNVFTNFNIEHIIILIITISIIVMAFTDKKTKEVYVVLNILCILASLVLVIKNFTYFRVVTLELQTGPLIASVAILIVLFITQAVGLGDSLLYLAFLFTYCSISNYGALLLILNILISNILFLIQNSKVFLKNRKEKMPLIPNIMIAWLILMPAMI